MDNKADKMMQAVAMYRYAKRILFMIANGDDQSIEAKVHRLMPIQDIHEIEVFVKELEDNGIQLVLDQIVN